MLNLILDMYVDFIVVLFFFFLMNLKLKKNTKTTNKSLNTCIRGSICL